MANMYSEISRLSEKFRNPTVQVTPSRGNRNAAESAAFLSSREKETKNKMEKRTKRVSLRPMEARACGSERVGT